MICVAATAAAPLPRRLLDECPRRRLYGLTPRHRLRAMAGLPGGLRPRALDHRGDDEAQCDRSGDGRNDHRDGGEGGVTVGLVPISSSHSPGATMKLGSSRAIDTERPRGSERRTSAHKLQLTWTLDMRARAPPGSS